MPRGIPGSGPHARKPKEAETKTAAPAETVKVEATPTAEMTDEQKRVRLEQLMEEMETLVPKEPAEVVPPGTILDPGTLQQRKKAWTMDDVKKMPTKTFIPPFSTPVIWNGIRINVEAGVEIDLPVTHYDTLMDSIRRNRLNDWYFGRLRGNEEKPPIGGMTRAHLIDVGAAAGLGRGDASAG